MTHWAASGVKCVCINDDFGNGFTVGPCHIPNRVPMLNEVLTVKAVYTDAEKLWLTFEEFSDYQFDSADGIFIGGVISFGAECFRPLTKRKTDISIFRAMLTPAGGVPVDA